MRRLQALDKMRLHPLDDDHFRQQILLDTELKAEAAQEALNALAATQPKGKSKTNTEVSSPQPADNEHTQFLQTLTRIPEIDHFPDGSTALDTLITPRKPTPPPQPPFILELGTSFQKNNLIALTQTQPLNLDPKNL